jgi:predicted dehydrogenase
MMEERAGFAGLDDDAGDQCKGTILVSGLGSIGCRHCRNLRSLGHEAILLHRTGNSTMDLSAFDDLQTYSDLSAALATRPRAVIVSNPTAFHARTALQAIRTGCHVLLEKPVSHDLDHLDEIAREARARDTYILVGFQYRFHPALRVVKRWLDDGAIGRVVSVDAHYGEWLPGWHPWEDYRTGYSARSDLGGGVLLTLCHPFDAMRWLIGEVDCVQAMTGNFAGLGIDVEDTAQVTLRFYSGAIGSVHLDYVERPTSRSIAITGTDGTIRWDDIAGEAIMRVAGSTEPEVFKVQDGFERNQMFLDEMQAFLRGVENGCAGKVDEEADLIDGIQTLKIVLAAKKSAKTGNLVTIDGF